MSRRVFYLLVTAIALVFLGYAMGCNGLGVIVPKSAPLSGFVVSNLSIKPARPQPNEVVTITVSVANTHDTWGIYSLVLKINGVKEAEEQATVNAGSSQDFSFGVVGQEPGTYAVFINGLSGSFTVGKPTSD